jgi:hypothetical protein
VIGRVERCGGPAPGLCISQRVDSVSLLNPQGQLATSLNAGAGKTIDRFSMLINAPGQYMLETKVDGYVVKRNVTLRLRHTVHANLIESIK